YCCCLTCYPFACLIFFFFFNDPATTEIYTLSLHDALPISTLPANHPGDPPGCRPKTSLTKGPPQDAGRIPTPDPRAAGSSSLHLDRKSTRLNSSHVKISYAVFCLKKKKKNKMKTRPMMNTR